LSLIGNLLFEGGIDLGVSRIADCHLPVELGGCGIAGGHLAIIFLAHRGIGGGDEGFRLHIEPLLQHDRIGLGAAIIGDRIGGDQGANDDEREDPAPIAE